MHARARTHTHTYISALRLGSVDTRVGSVSFYKDRRVELGQVFADIIDF